MAAENFTSNSTRNFSLQPQFYEDLRNYAIATGDSKGVVVVTMATLSVVGFVGNICGLYVLYLSFALKSGSVFLEVLAILDIITCSAVIPIEIYSIDKLATVDMQSGVCLMLSSVDTWLYFVTVLTVLAALSYILARCLHPGFPDLKKVYWTRCIGAVMLLSLLLSTVTMLARPRGLHFRVRSPNFSKLAKHRLTCSFREASILKDKTPATDTMVAIRLGLLALIALAAVAACAVYLSHRRQGYAVSSRKSWASSEAGGWGAGRQVDIGRLVDSVEMVVHEDVLQPAPPQGFSLVQWVASTLAADKLLIDTVIRVYQFGLLERGSSRQSLKPASQGSESEPGSGPPPNAGGYRSAGPLGPDGQKPSTTHLSSVSTNVDQKCVSVEGRSGPYPLLAWAGGTSSPSPPPTEPAHPSDTSGQARLSAGGTTHPGSSILLSVPRRPSVQTIQSSKSGTRIRKITFSEQTLDHDTHPAPPKPASSKRASSMPESFKSVGQRASVGVEEAVYRGYRRDSTNEANMHSTVDYMFASEDQQLNLRKEMIYQRALNRLERSGYFVRKRSSQETISLMRASRCIDHCLSLSFFLSVSDSLSLFLSVSDSLSFSQSLSLSLSFSQSLSLSLSLSL